MKKSLTLLALLFFSAYPNPGVFSYHLKRKNSVHQTPWHLLFPATGTLPQENSLDIHSFPLYHLTPKKGLGITIALIDTGAIAHPDFYEDTSNLSRPQTADRQNISYIHGTHTFGLLKSKQWGIAPCARVHMLTIGNKQGYSDKKMLIEAVTKAIQLKPDILLLCLKLDDSINPYSPLSIKLNRLLSNIPYVIAPTGNDGCKNKKISYPARFDSVTFTIGSFGLNHSHDVYIPPFSQHETGKGPHFLMPGFNIISTVPLDFDASGYYALHGTSSATALFAGFLALLLAEWKNVFSYLQIKMVLHKSGINLNHEWQKHSLYGSLDARLAAITLHILKKLKKKIKHFNSNFLKIIDTIHAIIIPHQAQENFGEFINKQSPTKTLSLSLENYVNQCTQQVLARLTQGNRERMERGRRGRSRELYNIT